MGPFVDGWTEADVETVIARGDPEELLYVPIVVGMNADECDRSWAESVCLLLVGHESFIVRGNAILEFGHIARTCRALRTEQIVPVIEKALQDEHKFVRGHAISGAEDLRTYLGINVQGLASDRDDQNARVNGR